MKTKTQVIAERPEYKNLICAVISRIGMDSVEDVNNHGIGGGFSGFIYTGDTVEFYRRHKKDILELAEEMAGCLGEDMLSMIQSFRCLGKNYSHTEIGRAIWGNAKDDNSRIIQNDMAWFAAEEVCRMFED